MMVNTSNNTQPPLTCDTCKNVRLQKVPSPGWFIAVSILLLGIPYLVKREKFICPNCKSVYYREPVRFEWSGRMQVIVMIILLFLVLILVEQLLNWLFNH